ncbi:hypothetical protein [Sinomonas sp. P47F7]|uniref:hypothetical protein n=1 Tax=Sinomonas sp. P47F7 TaxID=3410987 RepID=UPI003BF4985D
MSPAQTPAERSLAGSIAAHTSWAFTEDRAARTRPARDALMAKFEQEVDPEGKLLPEERARRAESLKKAYFQKLALKSAQARRAKSAGAR